MQESDKLTKPCMVCYENHTKVAFCQPCGHYPLCGNCLKNILKMDPRCPICRCQLT